MSIIISYAKSQEEQLHRSMSLAMASSGNPYSLKLINQSSMNWTFYVYQQMPNQASANVFSTAWFCSPYLITPGNQITFTWTIDYIFVWGNTGQIQPGITFSASGQQSADLTNANTTTFSTLPGPNLSLPVAGTPAGSLVISDAADVPNNVFSVGIGMGSAGTFVTNAGMNLKHTFTPTPTYWIAAGTNVQVGTILDITTVTQNTQVVFPAGVYSVAYTLGATNQWSRTA
jgi:hypothetical protein